MKSLFSKKYLVLLLFLLTSLSGFSQGLSSTQIDSLVKKSMKTFNVPGMAVAVIKDGKIVSKKGYGIRSVNTEKPVNTKTLFGVASNTKAFTSAALAQLIDDGKLKWDTKVTTIIPEFQLYNPYVTSEFTVRDLLTHRSGLGLGAGDLMVFPASNTTSRDEMIHNLRYLKPVSSFRSKFDYDNLLYIVAGEIVSRVSDKSYESYIENNFFKPLNLKRMTMDRKEIANDNNVIDGHAPVDGELKITRKTFTDVGKPAAGIYASIDAMTKWVQVRLNHGKYGKNGQNSLFSKKSDKEMWTPQTLIKTGKGAYNTHFKAYGLGWFLSDVNGYFEVTHTGGLLGIVSQVTMIPELDLGIIVLTNQQSGSAFTAITNSIKDSYFGIDDKNRIKQYNDARLKGEKRADSITNSVEASLQKQLKSGAPKPDVSNFTGTFKDPWFGKVNITKAKNGKLRFKATKALDLVGNMQFYKGSTYVVRWDDESLKADAFVNFSLDTEGKAKGFTMKPLSPLTDFSYDYQDLDFERVE
jgi:CubicO group peptidase (beta-lactamase class C family)